MPNRLFLLVIAILSTTVLFRAGLVHAAEAPPLTHNLTRVEPATMAPILRLKNMDDEIIDIQGLKGQVVVVNFWATWCPPCRREMGSLERLQQATREHNVEVLAVNIGEDLDTVFSFMGMVDPSPSFQILFDPDGISMQHWKVHGLPTTFIIDKAGKIAYQAVGGREFDHPEIIRTIMQLTD